MQEVAALRGQLLAAESTAADAVKEAGQLRQQLCSAQSRSQNVTSAPDVAELSRQTSSVFDHVMKETLEALKDEFQPSVVYKVLTVACCFPSDTYSWSDDHSVWCLKGLADCVTP